MSVTVPVCVPRGASAPVVAPAPDVLCGECGGVEEDPDFEPVCEACRGCGLVPVGFRLDPSRSHEFRAVGWEPGRCRLTITTAVKPWHKGERAVYSVAPQPCDWPGRSFLVAKIGTDRLHEVFIGADEVRCSCEGHEYLTSAKHNQRAYEQGEETFPTHGCVHADALAALVVAGWFDHTPGE